MKFIAIIFAAMSAGLAHATDYTAYLNLYEGGLGGDDHCGLFLETLAQGEGTGELFHVVGSVGPGAGMKFEHKQVTQNIAGSLTFKSKSQVGYVSDSKKSEVLSVAQALPPPKSIFNEMRKITPAPPKYNCQNWATDLVASLKGKGVIKATRSRTPSPERGTASGRQSPTGSTKSTNTRFRRDLNLNVLRARAEFVLDEYLSAREALADAAAPPMEFDVRSLYDEYRFGSRSDEILTDWDL